MRGMGVGVLVGGGGGGSATGRYHNMCALARRHGNIWLLKI